MSLRRHAKIILLRSCITIISHSKSLSTTRKLSDLKSNILKVNCWSSASTRTFVNLTQQNGVTDFVSVSQIKQKLSKKQLVFDDGFTCLNLGCIYCKNQSQLYINKVTGFFFCKGCFREGSWEELEVSIDNPSILEDAPVRKNHNSLVGAATWKKISKSLLSIGQLSVSVKKEILSKLDLEELPWASLENSGVLYDSRTEEVYWPFLANDVGEVPGYKMLTLFDLVERSYPYSSATSVIRLSADGNKKETSAILVPTLTDLLALSLHKIEDTDLICLPHGQFSLPQTILPDLEQYKKLVLWFADDVTSWNNIKHFAKKLSIDRCHIVRAAKEHKSAYQAYKCRIGVSESIKNAQAMSHSCIITFAHMRDDLLSELYSSDKASGIKWKRFAALNPILQGHRRGELTILTGPTGSGKTTFMSEYSLDLALQQVTTLWGSFEIRNQRLARTMLQQMSGICLQNNRDKFDEWADKFSLLPLYFMTFHGQQPLDTVMETVQHAAYVHDVAHVIIDNVQFMLGLSHGESGFLDRFYRQDALIGAFRNFATTYNCHVTLVIHPRKERDGEGLSTQSIFGGAKASQEADNVLIIQHKFGNSGLKVKKYLQVAKNRFSGDLGIIPLEFDRETLSFGGKKGR